MTLQWLYDWLNTFMPATAQKNVEDLGKPDDPEDVDSDSNISYEIAASEPSDEQLKEVEEVYHTDIWRDPRPGCIYHGDRWAELEEEFGTNPGATATPGPIEVHNLNLSFSNSHIAIYRRRVEEYSGAIITLERPPPPYLATVRIRGTVDNAYYAIKAYNAILDTSCRPNRRVWVLLMLEGPRIIQTARDLKEKLSSILPEQGFVKADELHVSVGLVNPRPYKTHGELLSLLKDLVDAWKTSSEAPSLVGRFDQVRSCHSTSISMRSTNEMDPISRAARAIKQSLEDRDFQVSSQTEPHITIFRSRMVDPTVRISVYTLHRYGVSLDFGPLMVKSVVLSDSVQTLSGIEHKRLAELTL